MGFSNQTVPMFIILFFAMTTTMAWDKGVWDGFYSRSCPQVESIVQAAVKTHFKRNPNIAPGLLVMFFHDCFVRGCDASVLIAGPSTERTSRTNTNLRGFEVIDDAKAQLEAICPGVVSCADILTLATRDAVVLTKGGPSWAVPTGRRDGRVSLASEADNLPLGTDSIEVQMQKFNAVGLNTLDLVTLAGAHTLGTAACAVVRLGLFNFNNTGSPDPSIDPAFLPILQAQCPENGNGATRVGLDTGSTERFDTSYYSNLRIRRGVLPSDRTLWTDASTRTFVKRFLGVKGLPGLRFGEEFGKSMVKMGNIDLKTGRDGEIRRVCSTIN